MMMNKFFGFALLASFCLILVLVTHAHAFELPEGAIGATSTPSRTMTELMKPLNPSVNPAAIDPSIIDDSIIIGPRVPGQFTPIDIHPVPIDIIPVTPGEIVPFDPVPVPVDNGPKPGLVTYLEPAKLGTFATNVLRMLFQQIEGKSLGTISEGSTVVSNQRLSNLSLGSIVVATSTVNNKPVLLLKLNNLSATYNAHIAHQIKVLFVRKTFKMTASVSLSGVNMAVAITPYINANKAFAFNTVASWVNIGSFKIKISSSNILVKILSVFTSLFNRKIRNAINAEIDSGLKNGLQEMASKSMRFTPSTIGIGQQRLSMAIQEISLSPKFIRTSFDLGLVGTTSTVPRLSFDLAEPGTMFGVTLGIHVVNQLLDVKKKSGTLNTQYVAATDRAVLPNFAWDFTDARYPVTIQQRYGAAYTASSHTTWQDMKFTATPGVLQFVAGFESKVRAQDKATGAFGDVISHHKCSITQQTALSIVNKNGEDYLQLQLPALNIQCTTIVGDQFLTDLYLGTLNYLSSHVFLPLINAVLVDGILIPKSAGMSLSNPQFVIKTNAITVGTSFSINL